MTSERPTTLVDGSIDGVAAFLLSAGILPEERVLDGSFAIRDVSRRNRNHRATWGDGSGVLVKQARSVVASAEATLRNEIAFYDACARVTDGPLPLIEVVTSIKDPPLLALRLARDAEPLWAWRNKAHDPRKVYDALGHALGDVHLFSRSEAFSSSAYARSLPQATSPWILSVHRPSLAMLRTASHAHLDTVRIVQHETNLGHHLESLVGRLRPTRVIHADMKADNILVEDGERVWLVDWELAQLGDPAWDVGGVLADALLGWLLSLSYQEGTTALAVVAQAAEPTRFTHEACAAFWNAYERSAGLRPVESRELLATALLCAAAHLVRHAFEESHEQPAISNQAVAALQVAVNFFADPSRGAAVLLGLESPDSA